MKPSSYDLEFARGLPYGRPTNELCLVFTSSAGKRPSIGRESQAPDVVAYVPQEFAYVRRCGHPTIESSCHDFALAMVRPSGETATVNTAFVCPSRIRSSSLSAGIPKTDRVVLPIPSAGNHAAVGREGDGRD